MAQSRQKLYTDVRHRELEFEVADWVFLKVFPIKRVMGFGKKEKIFPHYISLYHILRRVWNVAYRLDLPMSVALVYPIFHIFMLKKCIGDPFLVFPMEDNSVKDSLLYEKILIKILDKQVQKLRTKEIASVKVLWINQEVEEAM